VARAVTHCPNCGASVSQFAAGCAICGENLVAARERKEARREAMPEISLPGWLSQISWGDAFLGAILILTALYFPLIGVFISAFIAYFAHRSDQTVTRNLALIGLGLALVVLIMLSLTETGYELLPFADDSPPFPGE
jgi:hypothetical protein